MQKTIEGEVTIGAETNQKQVENHSKPMHPALNKGAIKKITQQNHTKNKPKTTPPTNQPIKSIYERNM
jgi:hypothetical protein